jgi:hypothetical protein
MRYWYDTEFIEDGKTIDLISIGIVAEDGREYYAQSVEFDHRKASDWVKENVLAHLSICSWANVTIEGIAGLYRTDKGYHKGSGGQCIDQQRGRIHTCPWRTRKQMKADILSFMDVEAYGTPELWAYYADYDHVAFCQLFGTMMDLPQGFPMYTRDIKQWADELDVSQLPEQEKDEHNALADARHNRVMWEHLESVEAKLWKDLR